MIKKGRVAINQLQWDYLQLYIFMCDFLAISSMHGTCMGVLVSLYVIGMGFPKCDNVLQHFLVIFG